MDPRQNERVDLGVIHNLIEVLQIFSNFRPDINPRLEIEGCPRLVFPVEVLDRYFETRSQIGQQVSHLVVEGFDHVNAEQMLDFFCTRFPNLRQLHFQNIAWIREETQLDQLARLTNLIDVQMNIFEDGINPELCRRNRPFTRITHLSLLSTYSNLNLFRAFFRRLFPNLVELTIGCTTIRFRDQLLAQVKGLFPRLTSLNLKWFLFVNGRREKFEGNYQY